MLSRATSKRAFRRVVIKISRITANHVALHVVDVGFILFYTYTSLYFRIIIIILRFYTSSPVAHQDDDDATSSMIRSVSVCVLRTRFESSIPILHLFRGNASI